ncbi:MAG: helix-turn-helix transcriptional regulator [Candidatus Nanopelagicales bacterium]
MTKAATKYKNQRKRVEPPWVGLAALRKALGLTLDDVAGRMAEETGRTYTRGAISAIERGHRGVSEDTRKAIALAYGLDESDVEVSYRPRERSVS